MPTKLVIIIIYLYSCPLAAAEPLQGPEFRWSIWNNDHPGGQPNSSGDTSTHVKVTKRRSVSIDAPIPIALWQTMPFLKTEYGDQLSDSVFQAEQRLGFGLLHHAAEGEPAWRFELIRLGLWGHQPGIQGRYIFNLVKYFPTLRLRPSDLTYSWLGLNTIRLPKSGTVLVIPELVWSRLGTDGLWIDLQLPQQINFGYRGRNLGLVVGVQQHYRLWQLTHRSMIDDGSLERLAKVTLMITIPTNDYGHYLISSSIMETLDRFAVDKNNNSDGTRYAKRGAELSLKWVPNA